MLSSSAIRTEAAKIKQELHDRGLHHADKLSDHDLCKLYELLSKLPVDARVGMAVDALVQWPRPLWLVDLLGPYPLGLENLNPADIATGGEWGSGSYG